MSRKIIAAGLVLACLATAGISIADAFSDAERANHPVVSWMMNKGTEAHRSRQSSSYCHVSEFTVSSGRIDCPDIDRDGNFGRPPCRGG